MAQEEKVERITDQVDVHYSDGTEQITGLPEGMREIASQLHNWIATTTERATQGDSLVERTKYASSDNPYMHMKLARRALDTDDLVSSAHELTEGLAFQGVQWEHNDWDTQDCFNQMAAEQNLDELVRKMWREEFYGSQAITAAWWDEGEFVVRGKTKNGNARKARKKVWFPRRFTILDNTKVAPVGMLAFGQEKLAWRATTEEMAAYEAVSMGKMQDEVMERFYVAQYKPATNLERQDLIKLGVDVDRLLLLDGKYVNRHTSTRSDYDRFANVRLRSIFRLLDMKQHLMEADRVALIGAANYILLVKKGDKDTPAQTEEIANVKANFKTLAKVPVIFSDHRLNIEIVTPKQDYTLQQEKYDTIDSRIVARLLSSIAAGGSSSSQSGKTSVMIGRPVARVLEGRRHMLRRYLEREIARAVVNHPRNEGVFTGGAPSLAFTPSSVLIDTDAQLAQQILSLRTQKEISRESTLEYFGFDQGAEAMRRALEEEMYDDIFKTAIPFSSPNGTPPAAQGGAGAQGGRPEGGGTPSQNPTKTDVTANGTTSTKGGGK